MGNINGKKKLRAARRLRERVGECKKCGSKENLTIDHIIPLIKGGSKAQKNWQVLCNSCNQEKSKEESKYANQLLKSNNLSAIITRE